MILAGGRRQGRRFYSEPLLHWAIEKGKRLTLENEIPNSARKVYANASWYHHIRVIGLTLWKNVAVPNGDYHTSMWCDSLIFCYTWKGTQMNIQIHPVCPRIRWHSFCWANKELFLVGETIFFFEKPSLKNEFMRKNNKNCSQAFRKTMGACAESNIKYFRWVVGR